MLAEMGVNAVWLVPAAFAVLAVALALLSMKGAKR